MQGKPGLHGKKLRGDVVLGFLDKGKMELQLEKLSFSFGDTIKGKVKMQLKKPVKARGVNVSLYAIQRTTRGTGPGITFGSGMSFGSGSGFGNSRGSRTEELRIFDFKLPLDGEKEYGIQPYEYDFEIKIPLMNQAAVPPQGIIGDVAKVMSLLSSRASVVSWYIDASLDIPMGFDVSKKVQLNIG